MKILVIKTFPQEINSSTYNCQEIGLALALRELGHETDILCVADNGESHEKKYSANGHTVKIFCQKALRVLKNGWFFNVRHILDQYDLLQVSEYNQMYTWHLAKKYKDKMVCYHGPYYCDFNRNYNKMAKVFDLFFVNRYRKLNTCFITKSGLAKEYLESKGLRNVHALGVGLGTSFLNNDVKEACLPEIEGIKKTNCLKLLYIGMIEPRRNALFMLDIAKELKERGLTFKLIMVGRYANADYQSQFEQKAKELSLTENIQYIARIEQKYLKEVYANADIFLLPTIYDIYGMVLLEAMYFGIPTITSVNGGSNMMIKSGENGYVLEDFKADRWAEAIVRLSQDEELRKKIGAAAHETIASRFTWAKLAPQFIKIYESKTKRL